MSITTRKNKNLSKKHALRAANMLQQSWVSHQTGKLLEAESIYQSILNKYPNYLDAMHLLALIASQQNQYDLAIARFEQILIIKPDFAEAHLNLGDTLQKLGRLEDAIAHFEQALSLKPNFIEAHYNLGNILHILGREKEAIARFERALVLKPNLAEAHYNIANVLHGLGQKKEAIMHFEQALIIKPDYAEAHNNLGDVLLGLGQIEDAIVHFQQAFTFKPDFAEAHNNLGNALYAIGQRKEALSHFEQALEIKPDYAEAHYNLGNIFQILGRVEEAIIHFKHTINIKSDFAEAYNKLGNAYREQGKPVEDYSCQRRAVALNRQNDIFWNSLARSLETLSFSSVDGELWQDLWDLLEYPTVSPKTLSHTIISAIRCHSEFSQLLKQIISGEWGNTTYQEASLRLSSIPLLLKIMTLSSINDLEVEKMLTLLRRSMILNLKIDDNEKTLPFSTALALHCFTNEYIFQETTEETVVIEKLSKEIAVLITDEKQISPRLLIALACYRSLYSYSWAKDILKYDWPEAIKQIIERQIKAPMEEQTLRSQIPKLTPIQDSVSQTVRGQYEENPYPLWIKAGLHAKAMKIRDYLQASPLRFDLGDYISPDNPEILVAGCGTGQHALKTATIFSNAKVLAVDLSLTSLSYALRKTKELGISNINYAQADIMELASMGQSFDLIESVGVLHHLDNPLAGWQILTKLLRPGGLMKIGLYSESARPDVISGRLLINEKEYSTSAEDIRQCRQDIIAMAANGDRGIEKIFSFSDFFHLSELRDLLFHVQEHRFTIRQIETNLQQLNLKFLGFELRDQKAMSQFKIKFPEKESPTSLNLWHKFETKNPNTFRGMYQFWLQKI